MWQNLRNWLAKIPWPGEKSNYQIIEPLHAKISELFNQGQSVALIYLDIANFSNIEQVYGPRTCLQMLQVLFYSLERRSSELFGSNVLNVQKLGGDDFALYISLPADWEIPRNLSHDCQLLERYLQLDLKQKTAERKIQQPIQLHIGYSLMNSGDERSISSKLYTALKDATTSAKKYSDFKDNERLAEFRKLVYEKKLKTVYQPIVSFENNNVFALEALARGPGGSIFESPLELFPFAEKVGMLYTLEKVARETAISSFPRQSHRVKLFLNIDPKVVNDPTFTKGYTLDLLSEQGLDPQDVVFEVTERNAIHDYCTFEAVLRHYRRQGFSIAVDDAGSGYSSLQSIAELRPEYIKLDISLIKNIQHSKMKQAVVETMLSLADKIDAKVIAEGIETGQELYKLLELGVMYGQGFFLARPNHPPSEISFEAFSICREHKHMTQNKEVTLTLESITCPSPTLTPAATTKECSNYFDRNTETYSLVVLNNNNEPLGLVMRDKLYYQLATKYGISLYWERSAINVMDAHPLILAADTPVEEASQLAMTRQNHKLYDEIIVTDGEQYLGNVSIQRLLEIITKLQLESARFANPLTELPGNQRIEQEIKQRLQSQKIFALIYSDLDNFKAFNDYYGFEKGDLAILLVKDVLSDALRKYPAEDNFLGHVGGDDFVVLTSIDNYRPLGQWVLNEFDRRKFELYDKQARENGYILTHDRQRNECIFPLMSISLAVVTNQHKQYKNHLELTEVAAEVKKLAKSSPESCLCVDSRRS